MHSRRRTSSPPRVAVSRPSTCLTEANRQERDDRDRGAPRSPAQRCVRRARPLADRVAVAGRRRRVLAAGDEALPPIDRGELTPDAVRDSILRYGCAFVPGLIAKEDVDLPRSRASTAPSRDATQQAARGWSRETTGDDPAADAATAPWYFRFEGAKRPRDQGRDAQVRARGRRRVDRRVAADDVRVPRGAGARRAAHADRRLSRRAARADAEEVDAAAARIPCRSPTGTRTAPSSATGSGRSTCGCRSPTAATMRPASTCFRAASTGSSRPAAAVRSSPGRSGRERSRRRRKAFRSCGRSSSRATRSCSTRCSSTGPRRTRR